jgi:hypothetical protein
LAASVAVAHPGHDEDSTLLFAQADSSTKNSVAGSTVSITVEGDYRIIRANGLPDHAPGQFPNRGNPNRIAAQNYNFRVPLHPQTNTQPTRLGMYPFGVAVNGVVFDPGAAEWWNGDRNWQYEPMGGAINLGVDQNNAHVQPGGAYHYHAIPVGLMNKLTGGKSKMALVGWAADGFPIYGPWSFSDAKSTNSALKKMKSSYRVKSGARTGGPGGNYDGSFVADYEFVNGAGDLDECNGRFGCTAEFPQGMYYYVLTEDWPFIPRQFRGTPDSSFFRKGPPGGFRRGGPPGGARRAARSAAVRTTTAFVSNCWSR